MRQFLLGFLTAAALAGAGYHVYLRKPAIDPCLACGTGTTCLAGMCVVPTVPVGVPAKKKPTGARRPASQATGPVASASGTSPAVAGDGQGGESEPPDPGPPPPPPPPVLRPEEKRLVSVGDKLNGTEVLSFTDAEKAAGAERELSQEDIDRVFRAKQGAILSCIDTARGDALIDSRVTVEFRIRRTGEVVGARLEAPAYLMNHGLNDCIRPLVMGLRFPISTRAQVVTYPFSLR